VGMSVSFGEILMVLLVCFLFFKPTEIKEFLQSFFSVKKNLEKEVNSFVEELTPQENKQKVEFFDVDNKCQKQQ
jgi:Sec-independent protein translocase protein TatA